MLFSVFQTHIIIQNYPFWAPSRAFHCCKQRNRLAASDTGKLQIQICPQPTQPWSEPARESNPAPTSKQKSYTRTVAAAAAFQNLRPKITKVATKPSIPWLHSKPTQLSETKIRISPPTTRPPPHKSGFGDKTFALVISMQQRVERRMHIHTRTAQHVLC
jgi:hypothetical protein